MTIRASGVFEITRFFWNSRLAMLRSFCAVTRSFVFPLDQRARISSTGACHRILDHFRNTVAGY